VCVITATAVTLGLRQQAQKTTSDASLSLTAQRPPLTIGERRHHDNAASRHSGVVSRSQSSRGEAKKATEPQRVVGGQVIKHKTKAQIDADLRRAAEREAARQSFSFSIGTFNVLGSQHSTPRGDHPGFPSARWRNGAAVGLMRAHGVDVLGLQEAQPDQLNALTSMTGMAAYPGYQFGPNETDNSILYDTSRFEFVSGSHFTIHFMHADRPQTILRLRDRGTGREFYVLNMHASAGGGPYAVTRRAGHLIAVATINRLKADGIPIFLTGDMNDRAEFFCRVAPATGMVASIGGSIAGGCHPLARLAVDWILGWGNVSFSNQWEDRSAVARKISDHFFVSATANVGPAV
jgi:endonuclease/exonuclease/phosphatase family metal-dependent hydrolase